MSKKKEMSSHASTNGVAGPAKPTKFLLSISGELHDQLSKFAEANGMTTEIMFERVILRTIQRDKFEHHKSSRAYAEHSLRNEILLTLDHASGKHVYMLDFTHEDDRDIFASDLEAIAAWIKKGAVAQDSQPIAKT